MIIIEVTKHKTGVKTIPGSETTVEVEVPVVFADTKHFIKRLENKKKSK